MKSGILSTREQRLRMASSRRIIPSVLNGLVMQPSQVAYHTFLMQSGPDCQTDLPLVAKPSETRRI
jgi:hypothetical protein